MKTYCYKSQTRHSFVNAAGSRKLLVINNIFVEPYIFYILFVELNNLSCETKL